MWGCEVLSKLWKSVLGCKKSKGSVGGGYGEVLGEMWESVLGEMWESVLGCGVGEMWGCWKVCWDVGGGVGKCVGCGGDVGKCWERCEKVCWGWGGGKERCGGMWEGKMWGEVCGAWRSVG